MVFEKNGARKPAVISIIAFISVPLAFTAYSLLVGGQVGGDGYSMDASHVQIALAFLILGEIGVICVAGWRRRLRVTSFIGGGLLLSMPILLGVVPGESKAATGYLLLGLVTTVFIGGLEAIIRYSEAVESALRSDTGSIGIVAGALHIILAIVLEAIVRGYSEMYGLVLVAGVVSTCFLFVMSVSSVQLWVREKLYSPAILLLIWFVMGAYGATSLALSRESLGASAGIDWSRFSPTPDYLLSAGVLLVLFVFVTGAELVLRQLVYSSSPQSVAD